VDTGLQLLVSTLSGIFLVPVLQFLKAKLNLKGEAARWAAFLVTTAFTIIVLLVTGKAAGADLKTLNFYLSLFGVGTNQVAYAVWKAIFAKSEEVIGGDQK
jgi:hypothetical protein